MVSIIIPTYNSSRYIKEAVDSALAQTYRDIEVIVVDDGSRDETAVILKPYIESKKITYIHQENKGLAGARDAGIRVARGEFIALLDSDDIFLSNKIERQVGYLEAHPECGVCYCDVAHFYEEEPEKLFKLNYIYYSGDEVFPNLLKKNFINPLSVVLRRSEIDRVGLFDESYRTSEDWEYWIRLSYHGVRFCFLPEILAKYRMRKSSLSAGWPSQTQQKATVVRFFVALQKQMTFAEQKKYHMPQVLLRHRAKLWYAELANYFPPLRWVHRWLQKERLT
jgi:glycosyltransferase involved in cell wall biosynthesis